jgi:hypothetical protein
MARINDLLTMALKQVGEKPPDTADRKFKKAYSERISQVVALACAAELRARGMKEARPTSPGEFDESGAERRMAGGIGAKKVDVTWATEESGLLLGISVKTINFKDLKTKNYQKNLTNRRGDMLFEAVTLHRRFPYAVLVGLLFLDKGAETDNTKQRRSTFHNAHNRLRLFTNRQDPAGRDEQYEQLYILLLDAQAEDGVLRAYAVGNADTEVSLEGIFDRIAQLVADRNSDFYECVDGRITKVSG